MPPHVPEWLRLRQAAELAERMREQERNRDRTTEQALIVWSSGGRAIPWPQFLQEWIKERGEE
jgi:hypothetical protein